MMKLLTAEQMREVDRRTTEKADVPSALLMENAGFHLWHALACRVPDLAERRVAILCGKGNNGGDGMVLARQLHQRGVTPDVYLFAAAAELRGDAALNAAILRHRELPFFEVTTSAAWSELADHLESYDVIVDALLGTGLAKPLEGLYATVVEAVNRTTAFVLAVDIPTGIPSDSVTAPPLCVHADLTVTFTAPKIAHALNRNREAFGEIVVADIGTPASLLDREEYRLHWLELEDLRRWYPGRAASSHKGHYGHVAVVAGSRGKAGAVGLASYAALRAGSGLVTACVPAGVQDCVAGFHPEVMTEGLPDTSEGTFSGEATKPLLTLLQAWDAAAVGPGLTTHPETRDFVRELVAAAPVPLVLDADGLNAFAGCPERIRNESGQPIVITPHPGEFARLTGQAVSEILADPLGEASRFAVERGVWVVLKDFRAVVAAPDGRVFVSPFGDPGMATAGMGDVLTGILVSFLGRPGTAQLPEHVTAAVCAGVLLHSRAGELAAAARTPESLVAGDVIAALEEVWREVLLGSTASALAAFRSAGAPGEVGG
ncbi:MAG: NAD(P)H-hydrate dehydratase [Acidobacteriota bacterium]